MLCPIHNEPKVNSPIKKNGKPYPRWRCNSCLRDKRRARRIAAGLSVYDRPAHGSTSYHKGCRCEVCLDWHRQDLLTNGYKYHIRSKFGLDLDEYQSLIDKQDNRCAICHQEFQSSPKPHIDHDHITGKIRGVLCHSCNTGIGKLRDSVEILASAIVYLTRACSPSPA